MRAAAAAARAGTPLSSTAMTPGDCAVMKPFRVIGLNGRSTFGARVAGPRSALARRDDRRLSVTCVCMVGGWVGGYPPSMTVAGARFRKPGRGPFLGGTTGGPTAPGGGGTGGATPWGGKQGLSSRPPASRLGKGCRLEKGPTPSYRVWADPSQNFGGGRLWGPNKRISKNRRQTYFFPFITSPLPHLFENA